jgi:hypothetical protein
MTAQLRAVDVGIAGMIFAGENDTDTVSPARFDEFQRSLPAGMGIRRLQSGIHDLLSADPNALQHVETIMVYIEEQVAARGS